MDDELVLPPYGPPYNDDSVIAKQVWSRLTCLQGASINDVHKLFRFLTPLSAIRTDL